MITDYKKAVEILTSQGKFHICLGLERVSKILGLLGNPQDKLQVVHVAGTNGKGSVCAMLSNILFKGGYNVGLYTSPHLFEYTERIKINNNDISQSDFSSYIFTICNIAQQNDIYLTEFEILTAAAYKYFFDKKVDIVIMETGLGGRLDATNVIKKPVMLIITSISIDHIDRLGDSIEKIAFEKAGIIKEQSSLVVSENNLGFKVIKSVVESKNASLYTPQIQVNTVFEDGMNYAVIDNKKYEFALLGLYQKQNLELVLGAVESLRKLGLKISEEAIYSGLKTVFWPARMQYIREKNLIIDGAHNVDAAMQLKASLDCYFSGIPRVWIYGSLNTKEYPEIVKTLFNEGDKVFFIEFNNKNSIKIQDIERCTNIKVEILKNIPESENILNNYQSNWIKIVSGSFYLIGEIFKKNNYNDCLI